MHDNPPKVFAWDPRVVPSGPILSFALRHFSGGLGGRTRFISRITSHWDYIHWEGEMIHDLSEVDFFFGHFICDCLEGFQGDANGY